ncbi:MAG TPA: hypothetical protein VGM53_00530 [Streptosporangiaceae bacterium]
MHDRADIYVGPHDFDDGDLRAPDGTPLPLRSQYKHWVEVRDLDRDLDRQLGTAREIYEALKAAGKWKLVLADDMQKVIDSFEPAKLSAAGSGWRLPGVSSGAAFTESRARAGTGS